MIFFSCSAHSHALSPLQWQSVFLWLKSPCLLSLLSFQQNLLHFPCLLYAEFFFYWIVVVSNWKWTQRSNSVSSGSDLTVGSVCPWHICRTNSYVGFHKVLVVSQLASSSVLLPPPNTVIELLWPTSSHFIILPFSFRCYSTFIWKPDWVMGTRDQSLKQP